MSKSKHGEATDYRRAEAGGGVDRGCGSGSGRFQTHHLLLEVEVRRHGRERGAGGEATTRRECAAEEAGRRLEPRQGHAAIGESKKLTGFVERRAEVRRLRGEFITSERRVCGLMEIPRMSYRYQSRRDDSALRERLLALAREKPRYGHRRLHLRLERCEPSVSVRGIPLEENREATEDGAWRAGGALSKSGN